MATRQQRMMAKAIADVQQVLQADEPVQQIYGRLCHKFPVLVRTCGLCQAMAFIETKVPASGTAPGEWKPRERAYHTLRQHVFGLLQAEGHGAGIADVTALSAGIAGTTNRPGWDMYTYTLATRLLLRGWIFYKRFAQSILHVDASDQGEADD